MLVFHEVSIGDGGVAGCIRCAGRTPVTPRAAEEVSQSLRRAAAGPSSSGRSVVFAGMEPFLHPDLPALVHAAVESGFERIRLRTDAGGLSRPGNAPGVLAAGVRQIEVVFLGAEVAHDALTGRPGLFAAAAEGVRAFAEAARSVGCDVAITGRVPVCRHSAEHVPEAVAALASLGAIAVTIESDGRRLDSQILRAALETGTMGLVAVSVTGQDVPAPYDRMPWALAGDVQ